MALWGALLAFGAIGGGAAPTLAEESWDCDGREDPVCTTRETETCTRQIICGFVWGKGIVSCCAEREINVEYTYYRGDDEGGGVLN